MARVLLCALVLSACTPVAPGRPVSPEPTAESSVAPVPAGPILFTPYVDVTAAHPSLAVAMAAVPARRFVLAFALASGSRCEPAWGGTLQIGNAGLLADVAAVRAAGGEVTVATGGAKGDYLENACATAAELAAAYRTTLVITGADRLEVDVEAGIPVESVAGAMATVHNELGVSLTVTAIVEDARRGLTRSSVALLEALAGRGIDVIVNAMVMNFPAGGDWRKSLLDAAESVTGQIEGVWSRGRQDAYRRLGLTIMAGRNDTGVVTTLDDARAVANYAREHGIGFLGLWSLSRDNGSCPRLVEASPVCSGVSQDDYEFSGSASF
jgi:chitinase